MGLVVVFLIDSRRFGLPLDSVERVARAVEITALPNAPELVLGIINVQGRIVPVLDLRRRLRLPVRPPQLNDQLVIARTAGRTLALNVDGVDSVNSYSDADFTQAEGIVPGLEFLAGVLKLSDGIILVHDLDRFLSLAEERQLDEALSHV